MRFVKIKSARWLDCPASSWTQDPRYIKSCPARAYDSYQPSTTTYPQTTPIFTDGKAA